MVYFWLIFRRFLKNRSLCSNWGGLYKHNLDYVKCNYCHRSFNSTASERHINFCREQNSRIQTGASKARSASSGRHTTTAGSSKSVKSTTNSIHSLPPSTTNGTKNDRHSAPKISAQRLNSQGRRASQERRVSHERVKTSASILSNHPQTDVTIAGVRLGANKDEAETISLLKQTKIGDKKQAKTSQLPTPPK